MMFKTDNAERKISYRNITKYVHAITFFLIIAFVALLSVHQISDWKHRQMVSQSSKYHLAVADSSLGIVREVQALRLWYWESLVSMGGTIQESPVHLYLNIKDRVDHFDKVLTPIIQGIVALQHEYADPRFSRLTDRLMRNYEHAVSSLRSLAESSLYTNKEIVNASALLSSTAHQLQVLHVDAQVKLQEKLVSQLWWQSVFVYGITIVLIVLGFWIVPRMYRAIWSVLADKEQAGEKLVRSEERFRLFVEGTQDYAMFLMDPEGQVLSWNAGAECIKGYKEEEIVGRHFSCFYLPDDVGKAKPEKELEIARTQGRVEDKGWRVRKDGSRFWANVVITALHDENGQLRGYSKITRDLTEQTQADEVLRESEKRAQRQLSELNLIYDTSPTGLCFLDTDLCFVRINQALADINGVSLAEHIGRTLDQVLPNLAPQIKPIYQKVLETREPQLNLHVHGVTAVEPDREKDWLVSYFPVVEEGKILGVTSVVQDITELKKNEMNLKIREEQQAVVAEMGQYALTGPDLQLLMDETVTRCVQTLKVEYAKVLELLPDGIDFFLRSGVGWSPGLVGVATVSGARNSQAGYTLLSHEPVVVEDLQTETRFNGPTLLHDHGVISGVSVIIHGKDRPYGVFGVHTITRRSFSVEDINFLKAMANILATAIGRKLADMALRESEELTRQVLEAIGDMVLVKDKGSRILWANKAFRDYYGMTNTQLQELIDAPFNDPHYTEQYLEDDKRVFETGKTQYIIQEPVTRYDGEVRLFNTVKSPIFNEEGHATKLVAVARDGTEAKEAEETLRASEEQYRTLVEHSPYCIHQLNTEGLLLSMNSAGLHMLDFKEERDVLGNHYLNLVAEQDRARIGRLVSLAAEGQSSEFEFLGGNGKWFLSSFVPIKNGVGSVDRIMGISQDISERKKTEETFTNLVEGTASMTRGAFFDGFIEKIALALGVRFALVTELVGAHGSRLRSLACWHQKLLDTTMEYDTAGTPCEIVLKEGSAFYQKSVQDLFPDDKDLVTANGESYLGVGLVGKNGQLLGNLCVVHDHPIKDPQRAQSILTIFGARAAAELERMRAEDEVAQALSQLRKLTGQIAAAQEQERKRIAQELHDEFGQALTGLKFDISWLNKQGKESKNFLSQNEVFKRIGRMSASLDESIRSIRRIASSLRPPVLDDLGLVPTLEWQAREFEERTSIKCHLRVAPQISELSLDPDQSTVLFRISQEFLTNVLRHANASQVQMVLEKDLGDICLLLSDNGRGIKDAEISKPGSLGILGMRERVELLGGEFSISGSPGQGTFLSVKSPIIYLGIHSYDATSGVSHRR